MCMLMSVLMLASCEITINEEQIFPSDDEALSVRLDEVAEILAMAPLHVSQMEEVHDAVTSSSSNGYDEEYTMTNLFRAPGSGVGDREFRSGKTYEKPLWKLIEEQVRSMSATKSLSMDPDSFLEMLTDSDVQIYWPFSDEWDGEEMPVITFDPEDGASANIGYRLIIEDDGSRHVEEVVVDEEMARNNPVWVVNRNSDAGYKTLEILRREDPDWGNGGGSIIVKPSETKRSKSGLKTLMLKDFTMNRNYDSWFAGASEFFVKIGTVEDFTATTEAELRLYNPSVTDFMIVVRRNQVGKPQPFNAILISDWSDQLESCALMITEDDGGTVKDWNCTALVRINSKSYGIEVKIPFNSFDDVVWRGSLTSRWFEANSDTTGHFGDVDLTFELMGY